MVQCQPDCWKESPEQHLGLCCLKGEQKFNLTIRPRLPHFHIRCPDPDWWLKCDFKNLKFFSSYKTKRLKNWGNPKRVKKILYYEGHEQHKHGSFGQHRQHKHGLPRKHKHWKHGPHRQHWEHRAHRKHGKPEEPGQPEPLQKPDHGAAQHARQWAQRRSRGEICNNVGYILTILNIWKIVKLEEEKIN